MRGLALALIACLASLTLTPAATAQQSPTIAEIATGDDSFSTLVTALSAASAVDGGTDFLAAVSDPNANLTVFAPTNAAFAALPAGVLDAALADPAGLLTDVLAYHVAGQALDAQTLLATGNTQTLLGQALTIEVVGDDVIINAGTDAPAIVITADIAASNGIVHVIDAVLLPPAPEPEPTPVPAPAATAVPAPNAVSSADEFGDPSEADAPSPAISGNNNTTTADTAAGGAGGATLALTGSNTAPMTAVAVALLAAGFLLTGLAVRREAE